MVKEPETKTATGSVSTVADEDPKTTDVQRLIATLVRMAANQTFTREDGRGVLCTTRYRLLCELVGATRESVSLVLGRLTADGLVERKGTTLIMAPLAKLAERFDGTAPDNEIAFPTMNDEHEQALQ